MGLLIHARSPVNEAVRDDADWLAVREGSALRIASPMLEPNVAAALVRRVGVRARRLLLIGERTMPAATALAEGVADCLVPAEVDSLKWLHGWLSARSARALLAGAGLVRRRGGDALERAEFARLFSEGVPRRGLRMFLDKQTLDSSDDLEVVTIWAFRAGGSVFDFGGDEKTLGTVSLSVRCLSTSRPTRREREPKS